MYTNQTKGETVRMYAKQVKLGNETGLHARPASEFVNVASNFASHITIRNVNETDLVNAKSIVMLLAMGMGRGMTVEIAAEGPDEQEAVEALVALIEGGFGEGA